MSGDDGDYVEALDPPLPVGKFSWSGGVKTKATSDDQVSYQIMIEVERAKGAYQVPMSYPLGRFSRGERNVEQRSDL